ncbi:MAG: Xaa-Pro peptidase family protein [Firmicutes bacterium]|nr:Xaa-Pro peptidase family protein [Bacillota bacterium]
MFSRFTSANIDAVLIKSQPNRFYFTGFDSSSGFLVLTEHARTFYVDARYFEEAKAKLSGCVVRCVKNAEAYEAIAQDLIKSGVKALGYEDDYITVSGYKALEAAFGDFALTPASAVLASLRITKTKEEVSAITAAQRIAERAFEKATDSLRPGVTEKELRALLCAEAYRAGADEPAFKPIVAFGENSAVPHHEASDRKLEKSDLILIDFGVKLNGYCSDMTRTFCLNQPSEQISLLYEAVLAAQSYALKSIKAGMTCREADSLAREHLRANGYGAAFLHGLGHGLGLEVHEPPGVSESGEELLLPGTVITVEPGVYIPGVGGVRIEDIVVVREDGVENLTVTGKELVL